MESVVNSIEMMIEVGPRTIDVCDNFQLVNAIYEAIKEPKFPGYTLAYCNKLLEERDARVVAELTETKKNLASLLTFGDIMQRALWPHDELEIQLNPGTRKAPEIVRDWREFVAKHLKGVKA